MIYRDEAKSWPDSSTNSPDIRNPVSITGLGAVLLIHDSKNPIRPRHSGLVYEIPTESF